MYALKFSCEEEPESSEIKLIWQPIRVDDSILCFNANISEEELTRFIQSLHPIRKEHCVNLPRNTNHVLGVGERFSLVACGNALKMVSTASGEWENIHERYEHIQPIGSLEILKAYAI